MKQELENVKRQILLVFFLWKRTTVEIEEKSFQILWNEVSKYCRKINLWIGNLHIKCRCPKILIWSTSHLFISPLETRFWSHSDQAQLLQILTTMNKRVVGLERKKAYPIPLFIIVVVVDRENSKCSKRNLPGNDLNVYPLCRSVLALHGMFNKSHCNLNHSIRTLIYQLTIKQ